MKIHGVVSGSFNRFLPQIQETVIKMEKLGIVVLSPKVSKPVSRINGFTRLEKDKGSPEKIERIHLTAIAESDFLYVVNPEGYIGKSVGLEIGYAISNGIPIFSSDAPKDPIFSGFIKPFISLDSKLKNLVLEQKNERARLSLKAAPRLRDLQNYVENMVNKRGFSEESLADVMLLLVEEIGELAKAVRHKTGLKVSRQNLDRSLSIKAELADCLIYLLDIANLAGIDLENAFRDKEALNSKRKWK